MQLAFGQKVEETCKSCGMIYIKSQAEDRKLHESYHETMTRGINVGPDFVKRTAEGQSHAIGSDQVKTSQDDTVCVITKCDSKWRRKHARAVIDTLTKSLGAVPITDEELYNGSATFEIFLYIRQSRCISAVVVESLPRQVRQFLRPVATTANLSGMDALARLRARREAESSIDSRAWQASKATYSARRGVARIWTAPAHRGQGLASALLDRVYERRVASPAPDDVDGHAGHVWPV